MTERNLTQMIEDYRLDWHLRYRLWIVPNFGWGEPERVAAYESLDEAMRAAAKLEDYCEKHPELELDSDGWATGRYQGAPEFRIYDRDDPGAEGPVFFDSVIPDRYRKPEPCPRCGRS